MDCDCAFEDISTISSFCGNNPNVTLFMSLVDLMLRTSCRIADPCRRTSGKFKSMPTEFDFIIAGGGVAGSVVAARLSENPKWKVLLLEAGPEEPTTTGVPAFAVSAIGTSLDWGFKTQPQNGACLSSGGSCYWPRGKMLGGTGSMTGMMYMRGNREIYDSWARQGNVGWSYLECLPFFKKSETNKNPESVEMNYHGTKGPLVVQKFPYQPKFIDDLIKAGKEIGYRNGDLNGANQTGIAVAQVMVDGGIRASTPRMYLRPASKRKNLMVSVNSRVTRIIIDRLSKRATGVEYIDSTGVLRKVNAKKEVILSAGAVGSPHLLLLSGVGPAKDLSRHNITVIHDLPKVGQNLHNHVSINVKFLIKDNNKRMLTMNAIKEYVNNGTGPLSSTGLTQTTAFLKSKYATNGIPDLQVFFDGFSASCSSSGIADECNDGSFTENCGDREINARPTNVMTQSKGYLTLKSGDPMDYPLIYPNYLSEQRDVDILVEGIKLMINITKTDALKKWNIKIKQDIEPKCKHLEFTSDQYWECVIRTNTGPENHPAGSCKMGPFSEDAVVDPELRVHGIPNLRVIDASIFPYVPNSNPIAAIVMVAEKGSHMIRGAWKSC